MIYIINYYKLIYILLLHILLYYKRTNLIKVIYYFNLFMTFSQSFLRITEHNNILHKINIFYMTYKIAI